MRFTDIFIKRPVFASVLSLLLLALGLQGMHRLPLRQFPEMNQTVVTVSTSYPGANAELVQGFITTPLQRAIATADGIDFLEATSSEGSSKIKAHVKVDYDADNVFTEIMANVSEARRQLPKESEAPIIKKTVGYEMAAMYISFNSDQMSNQQITEYVTRVVQPKLLTVPGLSEAENLGGKKFALRIWLDERKMTAAKISAQDVTNALLAQNYQATPGQLNSQYSVINMRIDTDVSNLETFKRLVIKHDANTLVRLADIAEVKLGVEYDNFSVLFNGKTSVFFGLKVAPAANPLDVINRVKAFLPKLEREFPPGLHVKVVYDGTRYIQNAIDEVIHTLIEATCIVVLVIFLFLGSARTVLIPMVTIPLSLLGVGIFLYPMGYSLNLLTFLAMVLAIGLVVDDAIVVVENIHRHIEEGMQPFAAALRGAREIVFPVIAMTLTLAAVYTPIMLTGGLTGALFKEFAFCLAATVLISGFIALTLSPMMCSKLLKPVAQEGGLTHKIDLAFIALRQRYRGVLKQVLQRRGWVVLALLALLVATGFIYTGLQQELAPAEDQSFLFVPGNAAQSKNFNFLSHYTKQLDSIFRSFPEMDSYFLVNGADAQNNMFSGMVLKPWDDRKRTPQQIAPLLQEKLNGVAGIKAYAVSPPALPGNFGSPVEFVLVSTIKHNLLVQAADNLIGSAMQSGLFMFLDTDVKFDNPQIEFSVDRAKAGLLGISMQDIAQSLGVMMSENYTSRFALDAQSYKIITQLPQSQRTTAQQLLETSIKTHSGEMIPLATVVSLSHSIQPNQLQQYNQLNAVTISGVMAPGVSLGDALTFLQQQAATNLSDNISVAYKGQSKQFVDEGNSLAFAFMFACLIIFFVLAAQFESFSAPLIILISVPLSIFGALLALWLGFDSLNIYSKIGMLTLVGLISKAGILMVDFANKLRDEQGLSVYAAIEEAAALRLRPILMTTMAMVVGVLPLVFASGAGAASRHILGLVIAAGLSIGTLFTLFVIPVFYTFFAGKARKEPL